MIPCGPASRTARHLALPYGVALLALFSAFFAGAAAGANILALFWISHVLTGVALVGWLATLILAFRRTAFWGLVAAPSALIIWAIAEDIPLLVGACTLAHACV